MPTPRRALAQARVETHLSPGQYGLVPYLLYLLYPPLYVAGPIITYNSFTSQAQAPLRVRPTEVRLELKATAEDPCT